MRAASDPHFDDGFGVHAHAQLRIILILYDLDAHTSVPKPELGVSFIRSSSGVAERRHWWTLLSSTSAHCCSFTLPQEADRFWLSVNRCIWHTVLLLDIMLPVQHAYGLSH